MFINHANRYHVTVEGNKTIATAKFAQKPVYGYAKCDPNDTFDSEFGSKLARMRCAEKINKKRVRNAKKKLAIAQRKLEMAQAEYNEMASYLADAEAETAEIADTMNAMLSAIC